MFATPLIRNYYRYVMKPVFFTQDPERVHDRTVRMGSVLGSNAITRKLTKVFLSYEDPILKQNIFGIEFNNPLGLSAGYDYDGHVSKAMKEVGFGFNTVGTVSYHSYEGNTPPRLGRLPNSKSLFVNKGFKSDGAEVIAKRMDSKGLNDNIVGVSVGSSNICDVDTIEKAIADYISTLNIFKDRDYVKYFEINISCPNTAMTESFVDRKNFSSLLSRIKDLDVRQPFFIKMPNEVSVEKAWEIVQTAIEHSINGFIFSNLVKDRNNPVFDQKEIEKFKGLKGNFSGKPTFENSNRLIRHTRQKYGKDVVIVGAGGIFNAEDAYTKIRAGANLIQMITGLIFGGPQVVGEINKGLAVLLHRDGFGSISEAVGTGA